MAKFTDDQQSTKKQADIPFASKCKANGCPRYASMVDSFFDDGRPRSGLCVYHAKSNFSHWNHITLRIRQLDPVFAVWDRLRAPGKFGLSVAELWLINQQEIPGFPHTKPRQGQNILQWKHQLHEAIAVHIAHAKPVDQSMPAFQLMRIKIQDLVNRSYRYFGGAA